MRLGAVIALWGALCALPLAALDLPLPDGAERTAFEETGLDTLALPLGPATDTGLPQSVLDGTVTRSAWRVLPAGGASPPTVLEMLAPIRDALREDGFSLLLDCADLTCGGFDYRREAFVMPAPDMYVNLRDFRALTAQRGDEAYVLLASRSGVAGFVQVLHVRPYASPLTRATAATLPVPQIASQIAPLAPLPTLAGQLDTEGRAVLDGVRFESGSTALGDGPVPALDELAKWLAAHPQAANLDLSRRRARAARAYLLEQARIAPARISADGVGMLAPRAAHTAPDSAESNRRVEVIVLP